MTNKIDHAHPLFLSSSNVPGAVQIEIQLSGMENYTLWSRAMELTLLTKNKLGFVDGSIKRENYIVDSEKNSGIDVMLCSGGNGSGSNGPVSQGYRSQGNMKPHKPQRSGYLYCDHYEMNGHNRVDCNKLKYCTHCHKHGHLKDVCFQLIGYPVNYKGKRLANNVSTDCGSLGKSNDNSCFVTSTQQSQQQYGSGFGASSVPQFTPDQYKNVLQMLNLPLIHEGNATSTNINANEAGNFAGNSKFNSCSFDWIVDSGATDHMVGTKNNLLTGRVKEIDKEDGGLYILKSPQLIDTGQHHKSISTRAIQDSDEGEVWQKRLGHIPMNAVECLESDPLQTERTGVSLPDKKSPFEMMFSKPPDLSYMRIIGCSCHATKLLRTNKFGPRAIRSVFMGYGTTQKGYKLYDLENKVFFISRDVVFTKSIFPFQIHANADMQAIVPDDAIQVPVLNVKADDHVCIDDHIDSTTRHSVDHIFEDPNMSPSSVVQEPTMSSTIGRRQSTRTSRPPFWQNYFVTSAKCESKSHCLYSLGDSIDYTCLSPSYQCCIANFSVKNEPHFYHQVVKDKRRVAAIKEEIQALEDNKTWR
ncbi:uncharacterized protein [Solanum lycopersicum]|uniref:uncharacterized protein n=1 Tax=Solanum lycopersicum TaxID=4081 RepID=UPI003747C150